MHSWSDDDGNGDGEAEYNFGNPLVADGVVFKMSTDCSQGLVVYVCQLQHNSMMYIMIFLYTCMIEGASEIAQLA